MKNVRKENKPNMDAKIFEKVKYLRTNANMTQQEVADVLGIKREEVSKIENDKRKLYDEDITKLAKKFNVPTDFLLGLTNVENIDIGVQGICEKLGLSEKAINQITKFKNSKQIISDVYEDYEITGIDKENKKLAMLNMLIENPLFEDILGYLVDYKDLEHQIKKHPTKQTFERHNKKLLEEKKETIEYRITKRIVEILNEK